MNQKPKFLVYTNLKLGIRLVHNNRTGEIRTSRKIEIYLRFREIL